MSFKKQRLGPRLVEAARSGDRYRDVHVVLGGTGAVGGTVVLQLLSLYEEMFSIRPPDRDDVPVLLATGVGAPDISAFTRRLFRFVESRHGSDRLPERVHAGYLTHSGVFVDLERFEVTALPGLRRMHEVPTEERARVVEELVAGLDAESGSAADAIAEAVSAARPFSRFLRAYRERHMDPGARFRSVVVGIPIPTLIAYHQRELDEAAMHLPALTPDRLEDLKQRFVVALRDDLVSVQEELADDVLIAHTTGVGGMEDPAPGGGTRIRLGFAHAALDRALADKARFAEELSRLYAEAGIKVLVTAAAVGIDEVRVRERVPVHRGIRRMLFDAPVEVFPGSKASQPRGSGGERPGRPSPAAQHMRVFPPLTVPWDDPPRGEALFERGDDLRPSYTVRSGENGFFTVANAESLYRVMRVASASELGLLLATVALLGEDPSAPWFPSNVCYYRETDNSRQVFDFLSQPSLRGSQLSGLEPMSLQDLGSAKHQGELHTLGLLILLHRLRTLDVDAVDPYVDLDRFDPRIFLVERSRLLTFEELASLDVERLARDMQVLAGAETAADLLPLTAPRERGLFPRQDEAIHRILEEAVRAVWTPACLGSPILFERDGRPLLRSGYYVAPLDLLVTERDAVAAWLRKEHAESGNPAPFEDFRDYHVAVGGFVDLRPYAIVCTARSDREDLRGTVARFRDEEGLRKHLLGLEPYSFFSTAGLIAVLHRLRALASLLRESMLELGSLQEWRWSMPRDPAGHVVVLPGAVEAFRMVSEGVEKATGTERLDGIWGYERRPVPDRRGTIPGVHDG